MKKISVKQKFGLVLFGLFLCIVLLEVGMRIGGFILLTLQEHRNKIPFEKDNIYNYVCGGVYDC